MEDTGSTDEPLISVTDDESDPESGTAERLRKQVQESPTSSVSIISPPTKSNYNPIPQDSLGSTSKPLPDDGAASTGDAAAVPVTAAPATASPTTATTVAAALTAVPLSVASVNKSGLAQRRFKPRAPVYIPPSNLSERSSRSIKRKKFDDDFVAYAGAGAIGASGSGRSGLGGLTIPAAGSALFPPPGGGGALEQRSRHSSASSSVSSGQQRKRGQQRLKSPLPSPGSSATLSTPRTKRHLSRSSSTAELHHQASASVAAATTPAASGSATTVPASPLPSPAGSVRSTASERRGGRSAHQQRTRSKRGQYAALQVALARSKWRPSDDMLLIQAMMQTGDLEAAHIATRFSYRFTLKQLQDRWQLLLYDEQTSETAISNIRDLPTEVYSVIQKKALFSRAEEAVLIAIPSTATPTGISTFAQVLERNVAVFHPSRTPASLAQHWTWLKYYTLLCDQRAQAPPKTAPDIVLNFSDAEDLIVDEELRGEPGPDAAAAEHELASMDRRMKREIRQLECEVGRWQSLSDQITGTSTAEFDGQTLAVIRGRLVRYLMRSKEITLGRGTDDPAVDVNLSLEGPASEVAHRQGVIKLTQQGVFFLFNESDLPIFVDGRPLMKGRKRRLHHNCVLVISCLRFIFLINHDLIQSMRSSDLR